MGSLTNVVAVSENLANWLNNIMDKTIFAIIADKTDDVEVELRANIRGYFAPLIAEGRQYLQSGQVNDDDSDDDVSVNSDATN